MCSLLQVRHPTRDQTLTFEALKDLRDVIRRYPTSPYSGAARDMIALAETNLASHELSVGRFYFKKKAWTASTNRFQTHPGSLSEIPRSRGPVPAPRPITAQERERPRGANLSRTSDHRISPRLEREEGQDDSVELRRGWRPTSSGRAGIGGDAAVKRIAVLGAGLVGGLIARDLAADSTVEVVAVDLNEKALGDLAGAGRIETRRADLSDTGEIARIAKEADVVVGAVPGFLGAVVQRTVIDAGRPLADISFGPEDPLALDTLAKKRGVSAVVDCGVAPGISNLFVGRSVAEMDEVEEVAIYVGGLPFRREWPYEYRIVFSPTDVIEEYLRPSRFRENGVDVVRPALSDRRAHRPPASRDSRGVQHGRSAHVAANRQLADPQGEDAPIPGSCGPNADAQGHGFLWP